MSRDGLIKSAILGAAFLSGAFFTMTAQRAPAMYRAMVALRAPAAVSVPDTTPAPAPALARPAAPAPARATLSGVAKRLTKGSSLKCAVVQDGPSTIEGVDSPQAERLLNEVERAWGISGHLYCVTSGP